MQQQIPLFRTTKGFKQNHKSSLLKCNNCGSDFLANRNNAKFCSSSCRSQAWLNKNDKKVITLSVPADIDDAFLDRIKEMLTNYKSAKTLDSSQPQPKNNFHQEQFDNAEDLSFFLRQSGIGEFKIPKVNQGVYYDEGLMIKKIPEGWIVKIS